MVYSVWCGDNSWAKKNNMGSVNKQRNDHSLKGWTLSETDGAHICMAKALSMTFCVACEYHSSAITVPNWMPKYLYESSRGSPVESVSVQCPLKNLARFLQSMCSTQNFEKVLMSTQASIKSYTVRCFYYDFRRFNPETHHYPMKPWIKNVMTVVLGSGRKRGFHQHRGTKDLVERRQLRKLMGMVVETRD